MLGLMNKIMSKPKVEATANNFMLLRDLIKDLTQLGMKLRSIGTETPAKRLELKKLIDQFAFNRGKQMIGIRNWAWWKTFAEQWIYIGSACKCPTCDGTGYVFMKEETEAEEEKVPIVNVEERACSIERKPEVEEAN